MFRTIYVKGQIRGYSSFCSRAGSHPQLVVDTINVGKVYTPNPIANATNSGENMIGEQCRLEK